MKNKKYTKWNEIINPGLRRKRDIQKKDPYQIEIENTLKKAAADDHNDPGTEHTAEPADQEFISQKKQVLNDYGRKEPEETGMISEKNIGEESSQKREIDLADEKKKKKRKVLGGLMDEWVGWKESKQEK